MHKLLVAYDASPAARRALEYVVATFGGGAPVQVIVLNVQERPVCVDGFTGTMMDEFERSLREEGERIVLEAAEVLQGGGIAHRLHVQLGATAQTIADQAESYGCDAIVMGTHGHGALTGLLLGSTATKVIHLVNVPVTLVK